MKTQKIKLEVIHDSYYDRYYRKTKLYLFSWDNVPGNDSNRLRKFLMDDLDIDWVESAEIHKSDDGKTIHILKNDNSAEIMIDEVKENATLKIRDGRTYKLKVKKEKDKLNIYMKLKHYIETLFPKDIFDLNSV